MRVAVRPRTDLRLDRCRVDFRRRLHISVVVRVFLRKNNNSSTLTIRGRMHECGGLECNTYQQEMSGDLIGRPTPASKMNPAPKLNTKCEEKKRCVQQLDLNEVLALKISKG